jgi:hypothetical protein
MADKNKESFNILSELTKILKILAQKINEQWAAMACFLAILVTLISLTLINARDLDGNEDYIFLTGVLFFTIILILGALIYFKDKNKITVIENPVKPATEEDPELSDQEEFMVFFRTLDKDTLQGKIIHYLEDRPATPLPQISEDLKINTAIIRKSADRLVARSFLSAIEGEKPKHISYHLTYSIPKN